MVVTLVEAARMAALPPVRREAPPTDDFTKSESGESFPGDDRSHGHGYRTEKENPR